MSVRAGQGPGECLLTSHLGDALQTWDGQGHHDAQAGADHQQAVADEQAGHRQALVPCTERGKWGGLGHCAALGAGARCPTRTCRRLKPECYRATHGLPGLSGYTLRSVPLPGKTGTGAGLPS